ncbi:MAG: hypothetical protein ABIH10_01575 [Spirochaetota bacterium]
MKEELTGNKKSYSAGQSTLEILIALFILTTSIAAAVVISFGNQSMVIDAELSNQALYLNRQILEIARATGRQNFNSLISSSSTEDIYLKEIIIENIDAYTKKIISRVSWQTEKLRPQKIELVTLITDKQAVLETGGDTGGSDPTGDWKNPQTLGSINLGAGISATDLDTKNKIVYLAAEASDAKKSDFFIVNVVNGQSPFIISSLNIGEGLNSVDVAGDYAYAVGKDDNKEFIVIDVSNSSAPVEVVSLDLPGNTDGLTIFYWDGHAYVGRADGASQEFLIINVSNPLNPSVVSGLSGVGGEINDIYVFNNRAYLGTKDADRGMIVVNVINPAFPSVIESIDVGDDIYSIYLKSENKVLVGEKTKFYIVNASNASDMTILGSASIGNRTRDIVSAGSLAFLATENPNAEFQVYDISNSTNPSLWGSFNFPQMTTGIDYEDNIVYVSVRSNDALRIITSSP